MRGPRVEAMDPADGSVTMRRVQDARPRLPSVCCRTASGAGEPSSLRPIQQQTDDAMIRLVIALAIILAVVATATTILTLDLAPAQAAESHAP